MASFSLLPENNSYHIFIILFLCPLYVLLLLGLRLWLVWFLRLLFMYMKEEQPTFAGWRSRLSCWLLGEHLLIMTHKSVSWVLRCLIFWFKIFIMGVILWLYQTLGLFIICTPDTDVTENSQGYCLLTADHKTLSFNLVISFIRLFLWFISRLSTGTSFRCPCITFIVYIHYPILNFFPLRLVIFE